MPDTTSDQDQYGPNGMCFGCGPANAKGLRIKSRWEGDEYVLRFTPLPEHQAFPGAVNGGILGTLFDCHSNWCAMTSLMKERGIPRPVVVTSEFHVKLKRPTPMNVELTVVARPVEVEGDKVTVDAEVRTPEGKVTATCRSVFVVMKPGHPVFHRRG